MEEKILNLDNLKRIEDEDLLDILFVEKDRLSRIIVDEFIFRGKRMIEPLWEIVRDRNNWEQNNINDWWAVIHATFILGAIGGKEVIIPLITSLRFSDAYDCDWVHEQLSSMFGKIGPSALEELKKIAKDKSNNWFIRVIALDGMAAITINHSSFRSEVFDFIVSFLKDPYEERIVRGLAGGVLLDFKQKQYEKSLLSFAKEEEGLKKEDINYPYHFDQEWVLEEIESNKKDLWQYTRNWLDFYDEKEIESRQKRWRKEGAWWGKIAMWWDIKKLRRKVR